MMYRSGARIHPCLFSEISIRTLIKKYDVSYRAFCRCPLPNREFPCITNLLSVSILNEYWILSSFFLTLQYCIGFAIYQHESAIGIHVFPILNPPPSPYHPSSFYSVWPWVFFCSLWMWWIISTDFWMLKYLE